MGHSAGGVFTQILLDHGFGAAGVAINSAPTEGVAVIPLSQIKATFPVLKNPANRHKAVGFTHEQWHYAFTNTLQRGRVAARSTSATTCRPPAHLLGQRARQHHPGHQDDAGSTTTTTSARRCSSSRAAEDHLMPPSIQRSNAKHYKSRRR